MEHGTDFTIDQLILENILKNIELGGNIVQRNN